MMDALGKYAGAVIGSYVASVALIVALVALSIWKGAKVKRALKEVEDRQGKDHG
ncbi:MAG: heme exporter protein D [Rhodobacteraceae bacterium]|uniref:heme exporter protein CcmD n=1 Tax=Cypionkella sp. TaxID=2811411 RepID=UPI00132C844D|nr:heme exporter protein CcmD [Cypionkella sp.]KAF0171455.1 MAG: heme exporter protein D [Paracoccaceae bacterium]MDO8325316.1 heme exporter protein CcmD [Cypionkella sp.]